MSSINQQSKDHYIPEFYLKRWACNNADQKVYSGKYFPQKNKVEWTPRSPDGTGYERDLYGKIEESFFKPLDDKASKVLNKLETPKIISPIKMDLGEDNHEDWAVFILSIRIRTPDNVKTIESNFKNASIDLETARSQIPEIIKNKKAIKNLRSLTWLFAKVNSNLELITCDNPLIFKPRDLSHPDCVVILPMGPKNFFLAARPETISQLEKNPRTMISNINKEIILNSKLRIYARKKYSIEEKFIIKYWKQKTI